MKNPFKFRFMILLTAAFILLGQLVYADNKIPMDSSVRVGKLANGLTYYIRKNAKPEKRVELRLAVNAGSVQEDENQLGLAHVVEHMCFDGTKNFPTNAIIHYLQSVGMSFGADLNAYTTFEETVYKLTIPTDSEETLNQGIQIIEDWSHDVLFETNDIDKERKVVLEEWRRGRGAGQRMEDEFLPVIFSGTKFANHLPIGTKESIEGSSYDTIKKFYKDWYRPDLMAVIVVGDIDPDKIEQKIKNDFSKLTYPSPRKKEDAAVPAFVSNITCIVSDKESTSTSIYIAYPAKPEHFETLADYRSSLLEEFYTGMLNLRLNELKQQANPPFLGAGTGFGSLFSRNLQAFQLSAGVSETGIEEGLKALITENQRVRQFGFTAGELERFKKTLLKDMEQSLNEKDKMESSEIIGDYITSYLKNEPSPGIDFEYNYVKENLSNITLSEINALSNKWAGSRVVIVQGIDKPGVKLPTPADINLMIQKTEGLKIEPYQEKAVGNTLIQKELNSGKIISEKTFSNIGVTELKLANGLTIALKPTDFKSDEILMTSFSEGGSSLFSDDYILSAGLTPYYIRESGAGAFSKNDLVKMLAGKNVTVNPYINDLYSGIRGSSTKNDLETMLQLVHLYFTSPRRDTNSYQSVISRLKDSYKNAASNPDAYYFNELVKFIYNNNPRMVNLPEEKDWNTVSLDKMMEVYQKSFANASNFTFTFTGSFDAQKIKPLLEKYLGSLPSGGVQQSFKDLNIREIQGPAEKVIYKGKDPKSYACLFLEEPTVWSMNESHTVWSLGNILQRNLIDSLRQKISGVYSFDLQTDVDKNPFQHYRFALIIPCAPENVDKLVNASVAEIERIKKDGLTQDELNKEIEFQKRSNETDMKDNNSWLQKIQQYYTTDHDFLRLSNPDALIKLVTPENLKRAANRYFDTAGFVKVILYPEGFTNK